MLRKLGVRAGARLVVALMTGVALLTVMQPQRADATETITGLWRLNYGGLNYCTVAATEGSGTYSANMSCTGDITSGAPWISTWSGSFDSSDGTNSGYLIYTPLGIGVSTSGAISGNSWSGTWSAAGGSGTFSGTRFNSHYTATPDPVVAAVGGTLTTDPEDNTVMTIPPGALGANTSITLDIGIIPSTPALPAGQYSLAKAYTFGPAGTNLSPCAPTVFQYNGAELPSGTDPTLLKVYIYDSVSGWKLEGGTVDTVLETITVDICHFSTYAAFGVLNAAADSDGDTVSDGDEVAAGTDPSSTEPFCAGDYDCDGFSNATPTIHQGPANTNAARDNCMFAANAPQLNAGGNFLDLPGKGYDDMSRPSSDGQGDACDPDDDNDGRTDADEASAEFCNGSTTDPLKADSDGDNFIDSAECALGTDPNVLASKPAETACAAVGDADGDGITNRREVCYYGTDPNIANTDGDSCRDGKEMASINANNAVDVIDLQQIAIEATGVYPLPASVVKADFDMTKNGAIDVIDLQQAAAQSGVCP